MLIERTLLVLTRIFLFVFIAGISGCMHTYYTPNMHQTPLLQQKGEAAFTAALSTGEQVAAVEVAGAYALSDHIGIMVNASRGMGILTEQINDSVNEEGTRRYLVELGAGYFKTFAGKGVFEVYGGSSLGSIYNYYDTQELSYSTVKFNRFFIQPGIGRKGKNFDCAFSLRFASVYYYSINPHNVGPVASLDADALQLLRKDRFYLLAEPAFTFRIGFKAIKFQVQTGYSIGVGAKRIHQDNINFNTGISVNLFSKSLVQDRPE